MRNACIAAYNYELKWKESRNAERAVIRKIKYALNHGTFLSKRIKISKKKKHITAVKWCASHCAVYSSCIRMI